MSILHIAFYPSDWLAGTRGLSDAETGVYITLIARMYEMAAPLERDDDRLYRLCGCKSKVSFKKSLDYLIGEGKITEHDGEIFNERVQKEIKNSIEKSQKAKEAATARWSKKTNKNNGGKHANASPEHMPKECQLEPELELKKKDTNVSKKNTDLKFAMNDEWPPPFDCRDLALNEMLMTESEYKECEALFKEYWAGQSKTKNGKKTENGWKRTFNSNIRTLAARWRTTDRKRKQGNSIAAKADEICTGDDPFMQGLSQASRRG